MNKKIKKYIPIVILCLLILFIILLLKIGSKQRKETLDLYKVSNNYVVDDLDGMMLYNRYQVEDGLLFNFVGSNSYDGYYGYYYGKEVDELPDFLKNIILVNDADYKSWNYDQELSCYRILLDDYNVIYNKLYGNNSDDFIIDEEQSSMLIEDNSMCFFEETGGSYTKVIDTYLVNIVRIDEKIVVYERVVFVDIQEDYLYFYKDYEEKELLCKLKNTSDVDVSFINNSEVVSNVLLEYQNELDVYEYTYAKGADTYYLESIKK